MESWLKRGSQMHKSAMRSNMFPMIRGQLRRDLKYPSFYAKAATIFALMELPRCNTKINTAGYGTNEMLYELPKQLTEAKNKGELEEKYDISSDNFVFISPDEELLLTPIESNTKWEKIYLTVTDNLSKDTTRATGRIAVEIDYVESARRRHQEIYDRPLLRAGGRAGQRQRRGGGGIAKAPPPNVSSLSQ